MVLEVIGSVTKVAAYSGAGAGVIVPVAAVSLLRRVSASVGLAPPTSSMLQEEKPKENCPLVRNLPALEKRLAWRSLGAVPKSPIHTCQVPSLSGKTPQLEFLLKREDLLSPKYGGNKVRTLQHQLAVCESRRERGEKSFQQIVPTGSAGSNQIIATTVHSQTLGWDGKQNKINPVWFDKDEPDLDNTLNMLSVLSFSNIGFKFNWGESPSLGKVFQSLAGAWNQTEFVPLMPGGNSPSGVLGQVGAILELAEQIAAGESPDPSRIYLPIGSACTVSGLIIGTVLARRLGISAFQNPDFKIVGCNVHEGLAMADAKLNFHVNPRLGFMPLTITHTIKAGCAALKEVGGPDMEADALNFMKNHVELKHDADVVGIYGAHSEKTREVAQHYDEKGKVIDADGKEAKNLWVCGHFVAKALHPLMTDLEQASPVAGPYMLWMTKSAVQPRGSEDEWSKLVKENETVLQWANSGKAESPKFRPGKVSTADGKADDYRSIMTKIM